MKTIRVWTVLASLALAAAVAFSQSPLDRKPRPGGGGGGGGNQGGGQKPPDSKPNNPPSKPPEQGPRPGGGGGNKPPEIDRPRPKPREEAPPKPIDERPRPKPPEQSPGPKPINDPPRPKPREEVQPPRPGNNDPKPSDDLLRPRPRPGQGNGGGNQGNNDPKPDRLPRPQPPQDPIGKWDAPGPIGRINNGSRNNDRPGDGMLGRRGGTNYGGSVSNKNRGDNRGERELLSKPPVDIFRGGLEHQVRREDTVRYANRGWRTGYYHYRRDWCDDNFWFNWYVFDPFRANCYVSPWYYYPHLPGYVNYRCVSVVSISLAPFYGTVYNWYRPTRWDDDAWRNYSDLDYALEDITRAFERFDRRALRRLIPYRDRVAIFVDGRYNYSMTGEDFEEFMIDAIEGTQTDRYDITRVERKGREAEVTARHDYIDSYGRRATVYHWYRLEWENGKYVIRRFGTSDYD